jgi:hypothetical protein
MTGYPGAGGGLMAHTTGYSPGLMSQQTGMPSGLMSQPTGMPGLMSQPTGMPGGLRAQPTGLPHDPRLGAMMQTFMPSNMSQVSSCAIVCTDPIALLRRGHAAV